MHQRTLLTTLPLVFLPHNRNFRPKTCQCTKEPFLLPFPSVFLPHNRNYRPKTCQCTKDPFLHFMVRFPICFTRKSKVGKCIAFQLWTPTYFFIFINRLFFGNIFKFFSTISFWGVGRAKWVARRRPLSTAIWSKIWKIFFRNSRWQALLSLVLQALDLDFSWPWASLGGLGSQLHRGSSGE